MTDSLPSSSPSGGDLGFSSSSRSLLESLTRADRHRLVLYRPNPKQAEFHQRGKTHLQRVLMAANQSGKSTAGAAEVAMHATGLYPEWWVGRRFPGAIRCWVAGITNETTRDNVQRLLIGPEGNWGTGMIPGDRIVASTVSRGMAGLLDTMRVRRHGGGESWISFKSFEGARAGARAKWQSDTLDLIWFDEEPPADIYSEGMARVAAKGGSSFLTFTPLLGMTGVVNLFYPEPTSKDRALIQMTIEDVLHIPAIRRQQIIDSYPTHEREARARGIPMLGSGRVFPISEERLGEPALETVPPHWPRIGGLDFGWDHPFAAVALAWDRDADCLHLTHTYRVREETPIVHCAALKSFGKGLPFAWPHDGHVHEGGVPLAAQYEAQGIAMLPSHATLPDGSYPQLSRLEASVMELLDRMKTGRFKVALHLSEWWEEFRHYHRKEGKIVKIRDDLLSATRMAVMMLRYARDAAGGSALPLTVGMDYDPLNPGPVRGPQGYDPHAEDSFDPFLH